MVVAAYLFIITGARQLKLIILRTNRWILMTFRRYSKNDFLTVRSLNHDYIRAAALARSSSSLPKHSLRINHSLSRLR